MLGEGTGNEIVARQEGELENFRGRSGEGLVRSPESMCMRGVSVRDK